MSSANVEADADLELNSNNDRPVTQLVKLPEPKLRQIDETIEDPSTVNIDFRVWINSHQIKKQDILTTTNDWRIELPTMIIQLPSNSNIKWLSLNNFQVFMNLN